ncbi:hypothetical protein OK006_1325 [Actinobacteria bacterium OK006]|nr:hypothetical protein OK006_1325 [Actinobacteria bacterium OK006]
MAPTTGDRGRTVRLRSRPTDDLEVRTGAERPAPSIRGTGQGGGLGEKSGFRRRRGGEEVATG